MNPGTYDYTAAGFDKFLSRSVDDVSQQNLDSTAPTSMAIPFDRTQTSGLLGNIIRVGNIQIDGVKGRISIYDGDNEVVRLGELDD